MKHLIYLDFNAFLVNPELVLLGTRELDRIAKANIKLAEGTKITFYDDDKDESGKLTYICDDGILEMDKKNFKWFAKFKIDSAYYLEPSQNIITFI